jgi:hypothetical protein
VASGDYIDGQGGPADLIDGQGGPADLIDGDLYAVDTDPTDPGGGDPGTGTPTPDPGTGVPSTGDPGAGLPVDPPAPDDTRTVTLESLDGTIVIHLNTTAEEILTGGATGLGVPPVSVSTSTTPGMPGSWIDEVSELEREVFLPLEFASEVSQAEFFARMKRLRSVVIPEWSTVDVTEPGTFRLVISSSVGERALTVLYKSGLEGKWGGGDSGARWERFGLVLLAVDPYWRAREPVELEFEAGAGDVAFLSTSASDPWPRQLSASVAIGANMEIYVDGDVPVWPVVTVLGPASFAELTWPDADVRVPQGVPTSSALVLSTDPRRRTARLDGAIAWNRIAFDSTVAPLRPGVNIINASVGTSGADTGLVLSWTPGYRTAW